MSLFWYFYEFESKNSKGFFFFLIIGVWLKYNITGGQ